jgi:serine/threonine protein kinase
MNSDFSVGASPVRGYRIEADLGGSSFYRMLKVRAPDGAVKLWKRIDLTRHNVVEAKLMPVLRRLRHPFLSALINVYELDDQTTLVLESDFPVASLRQRLIASQGIPGPDGLKGMAVGELLGYLEQVADAIDFLTTPQHEVDGKRVAIYHRGLRPDCLLLFDEAGKRVCKVADFGFAKAAADGEAGPHSQGLQHYEYIPTEFIDGSIAPTSDQFSLAVVYYELRAGELPFPGTTLNQINLRMMDAPKLAALPADEQAVVRRALAKEPGQRFPNCLAFVAALKAAIPNYKPGSGAHPRPRLPAPPSDDPDPLPSPKADSGVRPKLPSLPSLETLLPPPVVPVVPPPAPPPPPIAPRVVMVPVVPPPPPPPPPPVPIDSGQFPRPLKMKASGLHKAAAAPVEGPPSGTIFSSIAVESSARHSVQLQPPSAGQKPQFVPTATAAPFVPDPPAVRPPSHAALPPASAPTTLQLPLWAVALILLVVLLAMTVGILVGKLLVK